MKSNTAAKLFFMVAIGAAFVLMGQRDAMACGGLFCQNNPVDQTGERIVFTVNDDTITALIEIRYDGAAPDFSWILPIPEPIGADGLDVPDDGPQVFSDLHVCLLYTSPSPRDRG